MRYSASNIWRDLEGLKYALEVVQGHRKWRRSIDYIRLSISLTLYR